MAVSYYQFENIHPFHGGNGRMGRILNILYFTQEHLLPLSILYLSEYIIKHRQNYYRLLHEVRTKNNWLEWCIWLLKGVAETVHSPIQKTIKIKKPMQDYTIGIRSRYKFCSQDLIKLLFRYPYTKIDFVQTELGVSRPTATKYLKQLEEGGFLKKIRLGRDNFYFNMPLLDSLSQ